jgi:protein TonB
MTSQWKSLQLSLLIHSIILLALITLHAPVVKQQNVLIVDFTMGNEPVLRDGGSAPSTRSLFRLPKKRVAQPATPPEITPKATQQPRMTLESLAMEQVETQPAAVIAQQNFFEAKVNLTQFSEYTSQGSGSDAGFQKASSLGHSGGAGVDSVSPARSRYIKAHFSYIKDLIHKHLVYPAQAKKMGWEGKVITSFIISSAGCAKEVKISKSSGHEILDESAIKAINNASPFPKPPVEAQIIIPIIYRLN